MAFDKLVDSAALEANLKTVADAIRAKAGTSDSLAFPAGFAEAIAAIEAGGGSGGGLNLVSGSFTPSSNVSTMVITHGLGKIPSVFVLIPKKYNYITATSSSKPVLFVLHINGTAHTGYCGYSSGNTELISTTYTNVDITKLNAYYSFVGKATTDTITYDATSYTTLLLSGKEYVWYAG